MKNLGFFKRIYNYIPFSGAGAGPKNFGSGSSKKLPLHRLRLQLRLRNTASCTGDLPENGTGII
jgi:hypothetical protein